MLLANGRRWGDDIRIAPRNGIAIPICNGKQNGIPVADLAKRSNGGVFLDNLVMALMGKLPLMPL